MSTLSTTNLGGRAARLLLALGALAPALASAQGHNPRVTYSVPNFAYSPNLRKFVDGLPGVGAPGCAVSSPPGAGSCNENNLGQYIPLALPDQTTYPGSDYYALGLRAYQLKMHSDLPRTSLRGYYQMNGQDGSSQYLGPLVVARRNRPVRFLFQNNLPRSDDGADPVAPRGELPLPVDTMVMGSGEGPLGAAGGLYTQNRANIHLHGGLTPWISDGTPHQWITPAGDPSPYKKGDSFQNVPDMVGPGRSIEVPSPGDGLATYYYPNEQSARLMFFHDHTYGITRLNVFAGEAAGYLLTEDVEEDLITGLDVTGNGLKKVLPDLGGAYHWGIPLIIQDRTFVNDLATQTTALDNLGTAGLSAYTPTSLTTAVDPLWSWGPGGSFWFPHEYMPNEDFLSPLGFNPLGRWDYGPWMIPPMVAMNPVLPSPTIIPEAYGDTMLVNGTAFPYLDLPPEPVRFRILNACNDRFLNLQLYYAATAAGVVCDGTTEVPAAECTEVSMVPATRTKGFPATWPTDGRDGGVPDPATAGPDLIQIGNEGGFLVKPARWPAQPIDYDYNRRSVTFGAVTSTAMLLPSAVRADALVDLGGVSPGAVLILYNDAPSPMPLFDSRNDIFTDGPDLTPAGGAPPTPPGFGPNTRTIMQIRVKGVPSGARIDDAAYAALETELARAYGISQDRPVVFQNAYLGAFPGSRDPNSPETYVKGWDEALNVSGQPQPVSAVVTTVPGIGYLTPPTVVLSGGLPAGCDPATCRPATAVATLNGVNGITLRTAGSGYVTAPTVTIAPPGPGGIQATAVATISGGVVTAVTVTNPGSNYAARPNVTFTGGGAGAVQATARAAIALGSVGAIQITDPGAGYLSAPQVTLTGGGGTGAAAVAMLQGSMVLDYKNLVEGFDREFGRMNAVLGSTPNPLTPAVGAGAVIGPALYVDPPTEIIDAGKPMLWRINHAGVDSHAIHFHLFNVQVVNRVDWTNTIKPPYPDELGWKETVRTNPFEDLIVAIRPVAPSSPFPVPTSRRLLDVTTPPGSTINFTPGAPPPGIANVATTFNRITDFGWEYVWHCHLLGHEENDMMRPIVFQPPPPRAVVYPVDVAFGPQFVGLASGAQTVTVLNAATMSSQSLSATVSLIGPNATDFTQSNGCGTGVNPMLTCPVDVTFRPVAAGARSATLRIDTNDPANATVNVNLSGTGLAAPPAPTGLAGAVVAGPAVRLSWIDPWTASQPVVTFNVLRRVGNAGAFTSVGTVASAGVGGAAATYADGTVLPGTTYQYQVTATNPAGTSAPSNTAAVTLGTLPAAPSGLAATVVSATSVSLSWVDNSTNETSFAVWRSDNGALATQVGTVARTGTATTGTRGTVTFVDTTVAAGNTYAYSVTAVNLMGSSAGSNVVTMLLQPPSAPSALVATIASATSVTLSWTDGSTNEASFAVWRSANGGVATQVGTVTRTGTAITGTGTAVTFNSTGLTAGATYAFHVTAVNVLGASAPTATATVVMAAPGAPTGLAATAVATAGVTTDTVTLKWTNAVTGASPTGLTIQRATNAGFTAGLVSYAVPAGTTTWSQSGVAKRTRYYYRIRAANGALVSAWANATPLPILTP